MLDETGAQRWSSTGSRMGSNIIPTQGMEWQGTGLQVGPDVTGGGARMGNGLPLECSFNPDLPQCQQQPTQQAQVVEDNTAGIISSIAQLVGALGSGTAAVLQQTNQAAQTQAALEAISASGGSLTPQQASLYQAIITGQQALSPAQQQAYSLARLQQLQALANMTGDPRLAQLPPGAGGLRVHARGTFDINQALPWIIGGVALLLILRQQR